jgi:hypothetical protein
MRSTDRGERRDWKGTSIASTDVSILNGDLTHPAPQSVSGMILMPAEGGHGRTAGNACCLFLSPEEVGCQRSRVAIVMARSGGRGLPH